VICHERATAWLFHVGASQNYCVGHLSSRRSDCGLTMQMSCLKDKPIMRAGTKGEGHTWGRRSAPQYYTYTCTVDVKHTLSCTLPNTMGVGVPWTPTLSFFLGRASESTFETKYWSFKCQKRRLRLFGFVLDVRGRDSSFRDARSAVYSFEHARPRAVTLERPRLGKFQ